MSFKMNVLVSVLGYLINLNPILLPILSTSNNRILLYGENKGTGMIFFLIDLLKLGSSGMEELFRASQLLSVVVNLGDTNGRRFCC